MIHNTQTVNIDGTKLNKEALEKAFTFDSNDSFTRWVVRPVTILTTIGLGLVMFFASAFFMVLALAMVPFLALSAWAIKTKIERDMAQADPVVETQSTANSQPEEGVRVPT